MLTTTIATDTTMQHVTGNSLTIESSPGISITVVGSNCLILNNTNKSVPRPIR